MCFDTDKVRQLTRGLEYACTKIALRDGTCPPIKRYKIREECKTCERADETRAKCWFEYYRALGTEGF